jgi:heme exporter protein C
MRGWWWKCTGVVLLAYVLFFGLWIPLKPAISGVDVDGKLRARSGDTVVKLHIQGVNTFFRSATPQVILKKDSICFVAKKVYAYAGNDNLYADFVLKLGSAAPEQLMLNVITWDSLHGFMEFDNALALEHAQSDSSEHTMVTKNPLSAFPNVAFSGLTFPYRSILEESIRNLLFHVPQWFSMIILLLVAAIYSAMYLHNGKLEHDAVASGFTTIAVLSGVLGTLTGSAWARATWNAWWTSDPKLNGVAVGLAMYIAYLILRASLDDRHNRARLAAVYNLFVFPVFIALIVIMPRLSAVSLHPGSGDTVNFRQYDMDNTLRMFFYPAVIGWTLLYVWMATLSIRINKLSLKKALKS